MGVTKKIGVSNLGGVTFFRFLPPKKIQCGASNEIKFNSNLIPRNRTWTSGL